MEGDGRFGLRAPTVDVGDSDAAPMRTHGGTDTGDTGSEGNACLLRGVHRRHTAIRAEAAGLIPKVVGKRPLALVAGGPGEHASRQAVR